MNEIIMTRRMFLTGLCAAMVLPPLCVGIKKAEASQRIPVLLYHDIRTRNINDYTIGATAFAAQMEWLFEEGYKTVSFDELDRGVAIPEMSFLITFDDGYSSFIDYALPVLETYKFKATINVIGEYVGSFMPDIENKPILSWDEHRFLLKTGLVELGCHTDKLHHYLRHGALAAPEVLLQDLQRFQDAMQHEVGVPSKVLSWPYGLYSEQTMQIAQKVGFKYLLTSKDGYLPVTGPFLEIPRLNIGGSVGFPLFKSLIGWGK